MVRHIAPVVLQMIVRLSRERRIQLEIAAITGVSQGTISKIMTGFSDKCSRRPSFAEEGSLVR